MGPSLGPSADAQAHPALFDSPSLQDEIPAATCILGSLGPSLGSSTVIAGDHPALPRSPSILEEIMAAKAIKDIPWSYPGTAVEEEGVEAFLEAPLSENDHQVLLDMLPAPQALGFRGRGRNWHLLPQATFRSPFLRCGDMELG